MTVNLRQGGGRSSRLEHSGDVMTLVIRCQWSTSPAEGPFDLRPTQEVTPTM